MGSTKYLGVWEWGWEKCIEEGVSIKGHLNPHRNDLGEEDWPIGLEGPSYLNTSVYQLGCFWLLVAEDSTENGFNNSEMWYFAYKKSRFMVVASDYINLVI